MRGDFLAYGERPEAARPLLMKALTLGEASGRAQALASEALGYLHFRANEHTDAARWFNRATRDPSGSHLAFFYRAIVSLAVSGSGDSAGERTPESVSASVERDLRRSIELNPGFAPAYSRLSGLLEREGRLDEAADIAAWAAELEPDNGRYWVDTGLLLLQLSRVEEAVAAGEQALRVARDEGIRALALSLLQSLGAQRGIAVQRGAGAQIR